MFGRIRASPSSLDSLECSPPSKILKDDSFSIYVTVTGSCSVGDVGITTLMDTDCSSSVTNASPTVASESDSVSTENNVEKPRQNNVSILDFFKPKDPVNCVNLSTKNDSCDSVSSSGSVVSNGTTSEL
ncbi:hypothetical protein A2U01_0042652, partial [Trifolium medium]|nr:hypothetical protein [Trifolium medium]